MKKCVYQAKPSADFCYVAHSKPSGHPYEIDHMNAHIRTERCESRRKPRRRSKP